MKRFFLPLVAAGLLAFSACGNNEADNDTATGGTDTTLAAPADGMSGNMDAGSTDGTGTDMNNMDGTAGGNATSAGGSTGGGTGSNTPSSNMNNRGGADNTGTGVTGGQGSNVESGSNAAGTRTPAARNPVLTADGASPTSTRRTRDNVSNDSLNNRTPMGSSR